MAESKLKRKEEKLEKKAEEETREETEEIGESERLAQQLRDLFFREVELINECYRGISKGDKSAAREKLNELLEIDAKEEKLLEDLKKNAHKIIKIAKKIEGLFKKEELDASLDVHLSRADAIGTRHLIPDLERAKVSESKIEKILMIIQYNIKDIIYLKFSGGFFGRPKSKDNYYNCIKYLRRERKKALYELFKAYDELKKVIPLVNTIIGKLVGIEKMAEYEIAVESEIDKELKPAA